MIDHDKNKQELTNEQIIQLTDVDPYSAYGKLQQKNIELQAHNRALMEALKRIDDWGEHSISLARDYGSNGVRDYYRLIAHKALSNTTTAIYKAEQEVVEAAIKYNAITMQDFDGINEMHKMVDEAANAGRELQNAIANLQQAKEKE